MEIDRDEAVRILRSYWEQAHLEFKLYEHQKPLYRAFKSSTARKFVFLCSRRIGKSFSLLTLASEYCLSQPRCIVRYAAASQKDVREIIHPLMRLLFEGCPENLKPIWKESQQKYIFPLTESELVVSGVDEGRADNLRGTGMNLGIIDEAGFVEDLDYVVKSVLLPQILTTDGRLLMASTPPKTPAHPFIPFVEEARAEGALITKTIYDDCRPEVQEKIEEWMKESGGEDSTSWRREYLCEIITDQESALIPEFTDEKAEKIVTDWTMPPFCNRYVAMDLGLIDYTAVLFGYVDFENAKVIIEDEILINRVDSKQIADAIKAKESALWGTMKPVLRIADGNALTIMDFNVLHGLAFGAVRQDELEAQVNFLRLQIQSECVIIHPRCVNLIQQLKYGVWDKAHRKFDRSSTYGHFDLVAACIYFTRHVSKTANPYPPQYGMTQHTHFIGESVGKSKEQKALEKAFSIDSKY